MPDKRRLMGIFALSAFHHLHFGGKERKLLKSVWASHKRVGFQPFLQFQDLVLDRPVPPCGRRSLGSVRLSAEGDRTGFSLF